MTRESRGVEGTNGGGVANARKQRQRKEGSKGYKDTRARRGAQM
jgi:hypothetical protein